MHALSLKKVETRVADYAGKSALSHQLAVGKRGWLSAYFSFHQKSNFTSNTAEFDNIGCYAIRRQLMTSPIDGHKIP